MAQAEIRITAETRQAESAIDGLNRRLDKIETSAGRANKGLDTLGNTASLAAGAFAVLTAGLGIREIADYTARWTDLNSRLINATGDSTRAKEALAAISATAKSTYSSLETTAEVFLKNSMALNELGYTTNEQIKVSTALNNAMAVSGARGDQAASALDAFSKAIARGKFEGEDFNRIIENAPELVKALADGLGVTTAELRKMITEGTLTSDKVIPALISQMDKLQQKADEMPATISDGFILMQNSLFEFIGRMDEALGISTAVSEAFKFLANNIHLVIGGAIGIGIAIAALTLKMMGLATATALATGGLSIIAAGGIGVAMAAAAKEAGLFAFMTEKAVDPAKEAAKAAEDAAAAVNRQALAAKKLVDEQNTGLKSLFEKLKLEQDSIGLNQTELAIKRNLAEAARILKTTEDKITESVRERIIAETRALQTAKEKQAIDKIITDLDTERLGLAIQDRDQREIALAIRRQELEFGRSLNDVERQRLTTAIQQTQQAREQAEIAKLLTDATRAQTELEKLRRGMDLQKQLDPMSNLEKQYQRDLEALDAYHRRVGTSTEDALNQRMALEEEFTYRKLELQNQELQNFDRINRLKEQMDISRIEKVLMAERSGMAQALSAQDKAILQRKGADERQQAIVRERIEFEKKSELEKAQFAIQQGATVFNALGAQNKRAFEAAKAFNIANALMNTYMAATKALATYPFPFGLIAAAGAVAAGLAQVAQIRSQSYSGRVLGGPVMSGQSYIVGENGPELFTPNTTGSITRNSDIGGGEPVIINFQITANDTTGFDQLLYSRRGIIQQVISDAMLEKGRRSTV